MTLRRVNPVEAERFLKRLDPSAERWAFRMLEEAQKGKGAKNCYEAC